jgi:hypothetical protein
VARAGGEWPQNRGQMSWDDTDETTPIRAAYKALIAAHKRLTGPLRPLSSDGKLVCYARGSSGVICVNAGTEAATAQVRFPGQLTELLGWGAKMTRKGDTLTVEIPARSAGVFAVAKGK